VLAGVPAICQAMFDGLKGGLTRGDPVHSKTISAFVGEGVIAQDLGQLQERYSALDIGSYPFFRHGKFGASFVIRGTDEEAIGNAAAELRTIIRNLNAEPIEGETPA
jgi:molybdopterin-biosynthesis enzyme MoeA-like protein